MTEPSTVETNILLCMGYQFVYVVLICFLFFVSLVIVFLCVFCLKILVWFGLFLTFNWILKKNSGLNKDRFRI